MAHDTSLLLFFFRLLANGLVRRQNFIPVLIGLHHRIYLALVLGTIRMPRLVAETFRRGAGREIEPTAHRIILRVDSTGGCSCRPGG
jgi:hypothetical protein